jgi:hypothetical protein
LANRAERKIHRLLTVGKTPQAIFDEITIDLLQKKVNEAERLSIFNFAMNAGLYQQLLANFVEVFHEKAPTPWSHFMILLDKLKIKPSKDVIESVLKGARRQERLESLALTHAWDIFDPRFGEIRSQVEAERKQKYSDKKRMLLDKIEFYRNQRMADEERRAIRVLLKMYPDDPGIKQEFEHFQRQWARDVVARNAIETHDSRVLQRPTLEPEERKAAKIFMDAMISKAQTNASTAYNFAIGLKMMGLPEAGLKVLEMIDDSWASEWLKVELLIDCGRFVDCLNSVHELELRYSTNPEATFAATYARAKALHGLGQSGPAIDLLQSIVNIRPNYRSAYTLMTEWASQNL